MPNTSASSEAHVASSSVAGIRSLRSVDDRLAELIGHAEFELDGIGEIARELHGDRIVKPERLANLSALSGRRVDRDDLVYGIAHEAKHRKRNQSDRDHHADCLSRPTKREREHQRRSLVMRPARNPVHSCLVAQ